MLQPGEAFWFRADTSPCKHLSVVLTSPNAQGDVLIVNATDATGARDRTCVLTPADHPELTYPESVVHYGMAEMASALFIRNGLDRNRIPSAGSFQQKVLERIIIGGIMSPRMKRSLKELLKQTYPALAAAAASLAQQQIGPASPQK